jgi:hypothetical protein
MAPREIIRSVNGSGLLKLSGAKGSVSEKRLNDATNIHQMKTVL